MSLNKRVQVWHLQPRNIQSLDIREETIKEGKKICLRDLPYRLKVRKVKQLKT
jgi:hypothetical protein